MADQIEWRVWLKDGRVFNSADHTWEQVPDGVLAVRIWNHPRFGKMILWGDAYYGDPSSIKMEGRICDDEFERIMEIVRGDSHPPSLR